MLHLPDRSVSCACNTCILTMAKEGVLKPITPKRYVRLEQFVMSDEIWEAFQIPVGLAFFFWSSVENRIMGFYPSPMAAVEVLLPIQNTWFELERVNPILKELRSDIDALLVNRMRGTTHAYYVSPIDECYKLVGIMRTTWKGITGGREAEAAIIRFFEELRKKSSPAITAAAEGVIEVADEFVKVAEGSEVPEGCMKIVKVADIQVLLANVHGKYYAVGNICTHRGAPLSDGVLQGNIVTCPWHFSQFDLTTGEVAAGPASRPEPRYEVKIDGSSVLVRKMTDPKT
ncbi:MAG: Rieske (2Fe-2S) protein [Nitrososphaerales archaeon]|nr:Rieske (2Fe-2S) protein [Nitrososphaerales archaeon]